MYKRQVQYGLIRNDFHMGLTILGGGQQAVRLSWDVYKRQVDAQVTESLKAIGMENIRCAQTPGVTTVSFENNVYRSTYTGVGKACLLYTSRCV